MVNEALWSSKIVMVMSSTQGSPLISVSSGASFTGKILIPNVCTVYRSSPPKSVPPLSIRTMDISAKPNLFCSIWYVRSPSVLIAGRAANKSSFDVVIWKVANCPRSDTSLSGPSTIPVAHDEISLAVAPFCGSLEPSSSSSSILDPIVK